MFISYEEHVGYQSDSGYFFGFHFVDDIYGNVSYTDPTNKDNVLETGIKCIMKFYSQQNANIASNLTIFLIQFFNNNYKTIYMPKLLTLKFQYQEDNVKFQQILPKIQQYLLFT